MGHLWFHALHFPLCVTVINIPLARNTRVIANCAVYLARASLPPRTNCSFRPFCLTLTSFLTISSHSRSLTVILCRPAGSKALTNPILPSNSFQTLSPHPLNTRHPAHPVSLPSSPWVWNHSSLPVQTCWQEPYRVYTVRERERERTRKIQSHNNLYEGGRCLYKNGRKWNK